MIRSSIAQILEQLGLSAQKRALHIQFSNQQLNSEIFLQRIDGQHVLNQGLKIELICLSSNALIPLKSFIGTQVAVDQVTDQGQLFRSSGIITRAVQGQSDGALTLYKLTLEDATSLWHKRRNSRVFMDKSVRDITRILFEEWQSKSPLFAAALKLDLSGLQQTYDVRPFSMQSNETDYEFLTRLWRSEGINWLIDESELLLLHSSAPITAQKLRLIDDNSQYRALSRRVIRFHRSSATEQTDSMTSFIAERKLQPTAVHIQRWHADRLSQEEGAGSVQSRHQHSQTQDNASLGLEQAWHISPAWVTDLKHEDQATSASNAQIEKVNQNLQHFYDVQAKQFLATSTVRDAQVGYWFRLDQHPEIDQHQAADKEFLILSKQFYNQNNLPKDLNAQVNVLIQQSQWQLTEVKDADERQTNHLVLQRRNIPLVSEYQPLLHRPPACPQRAKVVGPESEDIYVDEWGRIKIRFLFTRPDDHTHDNGAGTNDSDTDSAWVDVLTPWAGEGYGVRFLPRIGEIVVIDFFDGNIDRPFVVGRIHEGQRSPTKFDKKGRLPETQKLNGIRSQEVQGEGFNQLRFDDTTGQISAQLHSSHAASQLNLGDLSHPKEQAEGERRGEGFELRTDQWGAIRAGEGLLISTHKQQAARGSHIEAEPAKSQLQSALQVSQALSDVAKNQQTDPLEIFENLKSLIEQIEQQDQKKAAAFKQAIMILTAPQSIALSTQQDIHLSADGQISYIVGESINLSTQQSLIAHASQKLSLFAVQDGARLYAGKGKVEIQAQGDGIDVIARKGIKIISTEDQIKITAAKKIVLTAGGSKIEISSAGILSTTGGKFEVKAGQHLFVKGSQVNTSLPALPSFKNQNWIALEHLDADNQPFSSVGYKIFFEGNQIIEGQLDDQGKAHHNNVPEKAIRVEYEQAEIIDKPWDTYDLVLDQLDKIEE
ncbi:type VI secretion system tip protein VgrG [Acinetobacter schindleri]|jgi:type VI secretion system secreted protein VgrG|uniref:type VI secretion system Vgr family protein n=1 Tax=Acinetobacter TaxID=469 RepID=UPI0006629B45|nr:MULTISPECIES: type VI secretion system Vgr family protein [Acinetobacter]KMV00673.1 type VI secretion system protein [Acinetobacter sp. VT 511]PUR01104.1 type VI secretion system tip protein VgrG [Acinetobacter schindleri]